jgi:steroid delta-isomerase-like uncharacterized protein
VTFVSVEAHKQTVRRAYEEVLNRRDLARVGEFFAPEFGAKQGQANVERVRRFLALVTGRCPDAAVTIDELVAEGDRVVAIATWRGTHRGEWRTPVGTLPPTGKPVEWREMCVWRLVDGKLAEEQPVWDTMAVLRQVGAAVTLPATE